MRRRYPVLFLAVGILACLIEFGCAGSIPNNPPSALNIAEFTLSAGALGVPYKQLLVASGGLTPYTWTISSGSLPPGVSVATDGIVSGTPVNDPSCASYPCTYNFTAKVTDSQTPTAAYDTAPLSIVINQDLSLSPATLPNATANEAYTNTFMASNGVAPYTYAVYGSPGLPAGLSLTTIMSMNNMANGATISGTPTTAGVYSFTIQATDSIQETATATFTLTVVGRIQGPYAFTLNGFQNGAPFYLVGSLVADGNGHITSGVMDQNGPGSTISTDVALMPSTYTLAGGTNFGSITLLSSLGTYNFKVVVSSVADSRLIMTNPGMYGSGLLKPQAVTTISNAGATNYSFGIFGNDSSGGRYAAAGAFTLNTSLAVTAGEEDINDNGTVPGEQLITGGSFATSDPTTGRGTATLTVGSTTYNYAFYIASATELVAIDTDTGGPATIVDIMEQLGPGIAGGSGIVVCASGQTCQNVLQLNGTNPNNNNAPEAEVGVTTVSGCSPAPCGGNISRSDGLPAYYLDQSNGGTLGSISYTSGTYTIDSLGRVAVSLSGATYQPVWYLVNTGQGFVVGSDPDVTQGTMQPQGSGSLTIASLLGSYLGGTISPTTTNIDNEIDVVGTPPPGGTWSLRADLSGPGGQFFGEGIAVPYTFDSVYGSTLGRFNICASGVPKCDSSKGSDGILSIIYVAGGGGAGVTGGKSGLGSINVGILESNGMSQPDPNPRLSTFSH